MPRKKKNEAGRKICYRPSEEALRIYNSWGKKTENLDKAIINFKEEKNDNKIQKRD